MAAHAATLLFNLGKVGSFVQTRIRVVVPRDGVETRNFGAVACDDRVGHADDGGRVHASTKLGEDGPIRTESALDGFLENNAEMFLILGVSAVSNFIVRIKIPILVNRVFSSLYKHQGGWRNSMDADIGSQMRGGKHREPAGDVLLANFKCPPRIQHQRIEDRAP